MKPVQDAPRTAISMTPEIPKQDQGLAMVMNLASIPLPYIAPIAGAVLGKKSPYVKFHSYRMLIEQVLGSILAGVLIACSLAYSLWKLKSDGVLDSTGLHTEKIDWIGIIVKSVLTWILFALWGLWNTFNSLKDAMEAGRGYVPSKPRWSERLAMKWSGLTNG
jgi:hypothetical protein